MAGPPAAQDNGLLVDELCRTTAPDIYAAGDVANHLHPVFGRVRVEHYNNAEKQGSAAARSMLGSTAPYDYVHSFWSDQYDHKLEYVGHATTWDEFVIRGSLDEGKLIGFYLTGALVRAAVGLDRGGDPGAGPRLGDGGLRPPGSPPGPACRALLADDQADLWSLGNEA